jgi:hypothetical protein
VSCINVTTRRLELLKLEGLGLFQAEIVEQLSKNAGCSKRTIYNDFESRAKWGPILQAVINSEDLLLKVINRHDQIYRLASMIAHTSSNELAKIGALNVMIKANCKILETAVLPEIVRRLDDLEDEVRKGVSVE